MNSVVYMTSGLWLRESDPHKVGLRTAKLVLEDIDLNVNVNDNDNYLNVFSLNGRWGR